MRFSIIIFSLIIIVSSIFATAPKSTKDNQYFIPGNKWTDTQGEFINAHGGGVIYHKGIYYWYGECKGATTYSIKAVGWDVWRVDAKGVSCYSSKDLVNWKNEGIVLPAVESDKTSDLHPSQVLERPKVIFNQKTKKFVMWLHVDDPTYKKASVGVATSDTPTGKFNYLGSFRPNNQESRDQTIFKDDDGRAYHICSSEMNVTTYISLLTDDYLNVSGRFTRNFINESREAPAVFKNGNKYYMISSGCTGWDPNKAQWAVADSMMGKWKIMGNPCRGPQADSTYMAQSTFVLSVKGKKNTYIAQFDRWNKTDLYNSRYVWLPLVFENSEPVIYWKNKWKL